MNKCTAPKRLSETASPVFLWLTLLPGGVTLTLLFVLALRETDSLLRGMYLIFAVVLALLLTALALISLRYRLVMDENGVQLGSAFLRWSQVQTAAVVHRGSPAMAALSRFPDERHFILLSVRAPEKAVDRAHFLLEKAKPGEELRIPVTRARIACIEHHLRMTLPTYQL